MGRTTCTEPQCLYKGALYFTFTSMATILTGTLTYVSSYVVEWTDGYIGNRDYVTVVHVCTLRYRT